MSKIYEVMKDDYLITTDTSLLNINLIHKYLSEESYWAKNIPKDVVIKSINNSICFGLYNKNEQIGFARLITDKATFAYLADVFILESNRGKGLSKWLMETIHSHPDIQGLRRWMLGTKDAHRLYKQFGWSVMDEETRKRFMQIYKKDCYK